MSFANQIGHHTWQQHPTQAAPASLGRFALIDLLVLHRSMRHTHSFNGPGGPHKSPLGPGSPMAAAAGDRAGALSEALSSSASSLPMPALLLAALLAVILLQVPAALCDSNLGINIKEKAPNTGTTNSQNNKDR